MIPKIIHYCWFGKNKKGDINNYCIETWKKVMPDYKLMEWNESNFDVDSCMYTRQAYDCKKWAFVSDYVRLYAFILVTITKDDYDLSKRMHSKECRYVHGVGIDLGRFKIRDSQDRNIELRNRLNIPYDAKVLLSVGELNTNKNHGQVIQALALLQYENIHYVICGEGELKTEYEKLGQKLRLRQYLHLMGFCPNVSEYYRMADLFVFPSLREGIPASIMEAMATGIPVIASDIRGIKDIVQDPRYRFDPLDYSQIADVITRALNNDNLSNIEENLQNLQPYEFSMVVNELKAIYRSCS